MNLTPLFESLLVFMIGLFLFVIAFGFDSMFMGLIMAMLGGAMMGIGAQTLEGIMEDYDE